MLVVGEGRAFERNKPGEFDYYTLVLGWGRLIAGGGSPKKGR